MLFETLQSNGETHFILNSALSSLQQNNCLYVPDVSIILIDAWPYTWYYLHAYNVHICTSNRKEDRKEVNHVLTM